jgi:hypothetical protein
MPKRNGRKLSDFICHSPGSQLEIETFALIRD